MLILEGGKNREPYCVTLLYRATLLLLHHVDNNENLMTTQTMHHAILLNTTFPMLEIVTFILGMLSPFDPLNIGWSRPDVPNIKNKNIT